MGERTGRYVGCHFAEVAGHGRVAIELMRGKRILYARCPLKTCDASYSWPCSSGFEGMTREEALGINLPGRPLREEEATEQGYVVLPAPTTAEEDDEEDVEAEIEREEKEDREKLDGGLWPPPGV